ncbi:ASCH domain-containing protein [Acinetobacter albensis]|uniref:ASCH domain-containing protein n=1 Tax=Acinetobacter TaxID=469 RepID=UPI0006AFE04B|nr:MULTISPECIES: ASCH domain-containing protein [Acinetobacter]ALD01949.1 RNA-binding protein [Acinetobacter sp. TTH0-4]MBE9400204.1 ASCH domain-containing protein [Acinetobacter albensis]
MKRKFSAPSIVAPNARRITHGMKTLELRSWQPEQLPVKDLLIIENKNFLNHPEAEEQEGAWALIDVDSVHILQPHEVGAECASDCAECYFAWQLSNILLIKNHVEASAKRKIY